jgi:hypothetical protein
MEFEGVGKGGRWGWGWEGGNWELDSLWKPFVNILLSQVLSEEINMRGNLYQVYRSLLCSLARETAPFFSLIEIQGIPR